jgi:hypothetical protein
MLTPEFNNGSYPAFAQESQGGPRFPQFPLVNDPPTGPYAGATSGFTGYPPLALGQPIVDRNGFHFLYVRASEALALGNWVSLSDNPAAGVVSAADTTGDNIHVIRTTITAATGKNSEVGNFLALQNSTGSLTALKVIKGNTGGANAYFTISEKTIFIGLGGTAATNARYDGDALSAAFTAAASTAQLIRCYQVQAGAATEAPMGIAMGTVTSGNNTIIQTTGLAAALGVGATTFLDNAATYAKAAASVSVTAGSDVLIGLSKSTYAGANAITVPVWLLGIEANW